jgi:hypothetical protein
MKHLYTWIAFLTMPLMALITTITVQFWRFMTGGDVWQFLMEPLTNEGLPTIDWLITISMVSFGLMAFVFSTAEGRGWKNFLAGIPLFLLNSGALFLYWQVELGGLESLWFAGVVMTFCFVADFFASIAFIIALPSSHATIAKKEEPMPAGMMNG